MANEQVNSLFDEEAINKQVAKVISMLDGVTAKISAMHDANEGSKSAKTMTDFAAATEKTTKAANEAAKAAANLAKEEQELGNVFTKRKQKLDELQKAENALIRTYEKRQVNTSQTAKDLAEEKILLQQSTKAVKEQAMEALGLVNAYDRLQKEFIETSKEAKAFGASLGINSLEYKNSAARANELNNQLKAIDAGLGNHQRNVGNYASAWNPLSNSINQLSRELPAFANSAQTGFMAISNNLPMLFDALSSTNKEIKAMRANGEQVPGLFKQLTSSIFSFGSALSIGVTLLTFYGKEVGIWFKSLFSGQKAIDELAERQRYLNESFKSNTVTDASKNIKELTINVGLAKKGLIDKNDVVKQYNDQMGETTGTVSTLDQVEQKLVKNGPSYIKMMLYKAAAQLALEEAAKKSLEAEQIRMKSEKEFAKTLVDTRINAGGIGTGGGSFNAKEYEQESKRIKAAQEARKTEAVKAVQDAANAQENIARKFQEDAAKIAKDNSFDFLPNPDEDGTKEKVKKAKDYYSEFTNALFNEKKRQLEYSITLNKSIADDEQNSLLIRLAANKDAIMAKNQLIALELQNELQQLEIERKEKIAAAEGNAKEIASLNQYLAAKKKDIESKYHYESIEAETNYLKQIQQLNADAAAKQKEDAIKAAEDKENARLAKISDFEKAAQNRALVDADRLNKQLIALNNDYLAGTLTSYEEYEQKKKDIIEKGSITAIKNQIRVAEELLSKSLLSGDERLAKEKELSDLKKQLTDAEIEQEKIATDKSLANQEKRRQKLQETLSAVNTGVANITQTIDTITSIGYEKNKARLEEERTAIEEKYAREVENIKNSTLSQQDQAAELKKIEADKQVQIEANERRRRQIELERAKFQRLASIAGIITGTAQAVVTALASSPPPLNLILAATVGALGVAQLAKAVATPLPKYAKGTDYHKGGLAVVGDGGKNELVIDPSGKMFVTPATDTIMNLPKGSKVLPDINDINAAMLNSMMKSTAGLFTPKTANDSSRENTIWLANQFAKSMAKNKPNVKVNTNVNIGREIYLYKNIFE